MAWTLGVSSVAGLAFGQPALGATGPAAPTWSLQTAASLPIGSTGGSLTAVSCTSATSCTAVGDYFNSGGVDVTLAEHWNGRAWSLQATPNPAGSTQSALFGVSCISTKFCVAVGEWDETPIGNNSGGDTLAEIWNGSTWKLQPTPNVSIAGGSHLLGVSCPTTSSCTAVGDSTSSGGTVENNLAEGWNGSAWTIESTPNPGSGNGDQLNGVSCISAKACTAVGISVGTDFVTVAEGWNGSTWSVEPTPNPSGTKFAGLNGVSCVSAADCTAAGYYENASGADFSLADVWNGTSWSIQPTPNAVTTQGDHGYFSGVACRGTTPCVAAGDFVTSAGHERPLAEYRSGTTWHLQEPPVPAGSTVNFFAGVSCASSISCTAVGGTTVGSGLLIEHWVG